MTVKKVAAEIIVEKWEKFKEKHKDGFDKKNKLGEYRWSYCECVKTDDNILKFMDNLYMHCQMREEDAGGEYYDSMRYLLEIEVNTADWTYSASLEYIPAAPSYENFECACSYKGKGYFGLVDAFDKLELGDDYITFKPDDMGLPYYMSGFEKFFDIILKLDDKYKRAEGEIFSIEYICEQIEKELREDVEFNKSEMDIKWDNFMGLYGVYDQAFTEYVLKSGRVNSDWANCYVGYNPYSGFWRVERNLGKKTYTCEEGQDIDEFLAYTKRYLSLSICIEGFVSKIRFFKEDLKKIQAE